MAVLHIPSLNQVGTLVQFLIFKKIF